MAGDQPEPRPGDRLVTLPRAAVGFAVRIVGELERARTLCPTYGPPLCVAGQLKISVLGRPAEGAAEIRTAYALTPYDRTVSLAAGVLDVREGRWADSAGPFRRCVELGGSADEVIDAYVWGHQYDLAYAFAAGDREHLLHLAGRLAADDAAQAAVADRCRTDAAALCSPPTPPARTPRPACSRNWPKPTAVRAARPTRSPPTAGRSTRTSPKPVGI